MVDVVNNLLTLYVNDQVVFEYEKDKQLEASHLTFLDKMDSDMDRGVKISGQLFEKPDLEQRIKFVVLNLLRALRQEEEAKTEALCAYMVNRKPELLEVHVRDKEDSIAIELVNEQTH